MPWRQSDSSIIGFDVRRLEAGSPYEFVPLLAAVGRLGGALEHDRLYACTMKTTRQGLLGNFVPLHDVVRAVADRIAVSDEDAHPFRRRLTDPTGSPLEAQIASSQIKAVAAQSRAACMLLEVLDRPPSPRPEWHDTSLGHPRANEGAARRGLEILVALSRVDFSPGRSAMRGQPDSLAAPRDELAGDSIGFEANALVEFLDSIGLPHALGPADRPSPAYDNPPQGVALSTDSQERLSPPEAELARLEPANVEAPNSASQLPSPEVEPAQRVVAEPEACSEQDATTPAGLEPDPQFGPGWLAGAVPTESSVRGRMHRSELPGRRRSPAAEALDIIFNGLPEEEWLNPMVVWLALIELLYSEEFSDLVELKGFNDVLVFVSDVGTVTLQYSSLAQLLGRWRPLYQQSRAAFIKRHHPSFRVD